MSGEGSSIDESCPRCGWRLAGGSAGCRASFDALLARDFSEPRYFATHKLLVDAYALQDPDDFCRSAKSLASHLVGLGAVIEASASRARASEKLRRWLNGDPGLVKPELPADRGAITLGDLPRDAPPDEWIAAVRHWAESIWIAYKDLHDTARGWARASEAA